LNNLHSVKHTKRFYCRYCAKSFDIYDLIGTEAEIINPPLLTNMIIAMTFFKSLFTAAAILGSITGPVSSFAPTSHGVARSATSLKVGVETVCVNVVVDWLLAIFLCNDDRCL
jgi:hypothetical protein